MKYRSILLALVIAQTILCNAYVLAQDYERKYVFSKDTTCTSCIMVTKAIGYNEDYGFDLGTEKHVRFLAESVYSDQPFFFSMAVPEGNYLITVHYEGLSKSYRSVVRSESRRWQLAHVEVKPNKRISRSFVVNRKDASINGNKEVLLKKPREVLKLDWDKKLTLEFQGVNNIKAIEVKAVPNLITVFLAGNSTVCNQEEEPWASWGQMIPRYFNQHVAIANHAESGLSLGSFLSQHRLEKILSVAKPGDYLFIEFGHNDQKERGEQAGAYKSYSDRLRLFVRLFKEKGGFPIIITSTARRSFDAAGHLEYTLGDFPQAARDVANELEVPLIDLNKMTRIFYQTMGVEESKNAFVHYPAGTFAGQIEDLKDNTHFNTYGAYQISKMILQEIKRQNLALKKYIIDFKNYNPAKPDAFQDWIWPLSTVNSSVKPDGN